MSDNQLAIFGDKGEMPAELAAMGAVGNENVSAEDMQIPRLNLLQAMSAATEELEGARAGLIHNSITDDLYESVYVVPVYYDKKYTIFKDRSLGNEFLGNFDTREEAAAHLAAERSGSEDDYNIIETGRHALYALDMDGNKIGPAELLCSGSKMNFSRRWNTDISKRCGDSRPRFCAVWKLSTVKQKNERGSWYNYKAEFVNWTPTSILDDVTKLYDSISGANAADAA